MKTKRWNYNKVKLIKITINISKSTYAKNLKFLTVAMLNYNKKFNKEKYKERVK